MTLILSTFMKQWDILYTKPCQEKLAMQHLQNQAYEVYLLLVQIEKNHQGISLGRMNYCLKALMKKCLAKMKNFANSKNKVTTFIYSLQPVLHKRWILLTDSCSARLMSMRCSRPKLRLSIRKL